MRSFLFQFRDAQFVAGPHAVTVVSSTPASVCTTLDEESERRRTAIVGVIRKDNSRQRRQFVRLASTTVVVPAVVLQIR